MPTISVMISAFLSQPNRAYTSLTTQLKTVTIVKYRKSRNVKYFCDFREQRKKTRYILQRDGLVPTAFLDSLSHAKSLPTAAW